MDPGLLVVFSLIGISLFLFVTEPVPLDVTAIGLMVTLILLEPWTGVTPEEGVRGFSNPATLTVLAMFMLSEGIQRTGLVQTITEWIESFTSSNEDRSLLALMGLAGPTSGFLNNTPVVAILIPVARKLARNVRVSPSRFLMPLSYISMLGGTLTLIGTSTTILASDISARLINRPISMFEFTLLGTVMMIVGGMYLYFLGWYLIPDRVKAETNLIEEFDMEEYLTEVTVLEGSKLIGTKVGHLTENEDPDLDISQIIRNGRSVTGNVDRYTIQAGDLLLVRASRETMLAVMDEEHLDIPVPEPDQLPEHVKEEAEPGTTAPAGDVQDGDTMVEVVLLPTCPVVGQSLRETSFRDQYNATVLAIRRGGEVIRSRMKNLKLKVGDTLLIQAQPEDVDRISNLQGFIVSDTKFSGAHRKESIPVVIAIMAGVILLPAFNVMSIMVSALAGVVAMFSLGCLRPKEAYEAVNWDVIFLLAGLIPLGAAMEHTGADQFLAQQILNLSAVFPAWGLLLVIYLITALLTNVVVNTATVIVMLPIAIQVAQSVGAAEFSFVLAVTLSAATAFLSPVGYQTNLMVYGPGGYKFSDFARVGAPLQILMAFIVTGGILLLWGV